EFPWLPLIVLVLVSVVLIAFSDGLGMLPVTLLSTSGVLFAAHFVVGQTVEVVHPRTILFSAPISLLATASFLVQGSRSKSVIAQGVGAAAIAVISFTTIWDSLPLLRAPERSSQQHRLAQCIEQKHPHADVWAPRLGVAY